MRAHLHLSSIWRRSEDRACFHWQAGDGACPKCGTARQESTFSGGRGEILESLLRPPWQRILWKQQPYKDNHTDATFLEHLVKNANFVEYDFWR
jgi:hypothetical protein